METLSRTAPDAISAPALDERTARRLREIQRAALHSQLQAAVRAAGKAVRA